MTLKDARKAKGYTLEQLAQVCGTNKGHLSRIENGTRNPSDDLISKLTAVLGSFDVAERAKFTRADIFESIGQVYGFVSAKIPSIADPAKLAYAVEHPTLALLELAKKAIPMCILSEQDNMWIAKIMSDIDRCDYLTGDQTASNAEQTAFLLGYYNGIKRHISEVQNGQ